jgi:hypothetical protein
MGNAFIAVSDDGTAASWNPAGLSQLRRPELSVVFSASRRQEELEGFRTFDRAAMFTSLSSATTTGNLEFASGALPFTLFGKPVTIQAGWRRLFDFSGGIEGDVTRVPFSAASRPESVIHLDNGSDGHVNLVTIAGAIRLNRRLSLGIGTEFLPRPVVGPQSAQSRRPGLLIRRFRQFRRHQRVGRPRLQPGPAPGVPDGPVWRRVPRTSQDRFRDHPDPAVQPRSANRRRCRSR